MLSKIFSSALEKQQGLVSEIEIHRGDNYSFQMDNHRHRSALELLSKARSASREGQMNEAWVCLIDAASEISYLRAVRDARSRIEPSAQIRDMQSENGRKGAQVRRANGDRRRDQLAEKIILASRDEKTFSLAKLTKKFTDLAPSASLPPNDYQFRKILKRKDIQAILAPTLRRQR